MQLRSAAFTDGTTIPRRYTCSGEGISPPLAWSDVPGDVRELALVVEDPDAGRFVHWTVLHIAPTTRRIAEDDTPPGGVETANGFGDRGWGAPCPPAGNAPHRYVFALYALRAPIGLGADASAPDVRAALAKLAIARGTLTGLFGR